ncbi:MAG TPA: XRE family transcriptional regulator [Lutibacter sp.]|nr:XRE family transcriptional regulator [Lutibacter sp.]
MKIGNKLRVKRDNKKLSQQEIADYLHISQRTYSNFESDKSEPSLTQLSKLAEVLEFNLLDMLQEQGLVFNQSYNEFKDNSQCIIIMKQKNLLHN